MKIYETYNVLGHNVDIQMTNISADLLDFSCKIKVDNNNERISCCSFNKGEAFNPEKALIEVIEESLSYAKSPNLGKFIKDGKYDGSEQEINAGDMVFRAAKNSHIWLINNFTKDEVKELYKAIEPDLDLDSIGKEVFFKTNTLSFGSSRDTIDDDFEQEQLENSNDYEDFER